MRIKSRRAITAGFALMLMGCGGGEFARELGIDLAKMTESESGLYYEDLVVGSGPTAANGTRAVVHYTGWLADGTKFDSSHDRGEPYPLSLPGRVIDGWNQGVPGMKVGGKRRLVIPPELGYGAVGSPPVIPPNATLVFEIELLNVES